MTQPTGLYTWIQSNDGRSTGLFVAFLLAIQLIAPLALVGPLLLVDIDHAPFFGWGGYLLRYAPVVLVGSIVWFAVQFWWHVETVKRAVGFHFVDAADEPRLCAVIEPLIILTGLPVPFVGVIESDARNAFACGIGRKKAVVVVTRGLIDALTDAELASVLAHELSHIRNGDIRLMAAANIFMSALQRLHARNVLRFTPIHALLAVAVPAVLPLSLAGGLLGRLALRGGQVSRLLIASSREFIADAEAAQWTRDPGALASALLKVDGRHRIGGARDEDDAMMIAGDSEGPTATHPTVAQRVAALARVTGSMVFNAPNAPRDGDWTPTVSRGGVERAAFGRRALATEAIARVRQGDGENLLGLTRWGVLWLVLTIGALIGIHWDDLDKPRAMAAKFDARPIGLVLGTPVACELSPFSSHFNARCDAGTANGSFQAFEGQRGTLAGWLGEIGRQRRARGARGDGSLIDSLGGRTDGPPGTPPRLQAAVNLMGMAEGPRVPMRGCSPTRQRQALPVGERPPAELGRFEELDWVRGQLATLARDTQAAPADAATVMRYLQQREALLDHALAVNGRLGLEAVQSALATDAQIDALNRLGQVAGDPAALRALGPAGQAQLTTLLQEPLAIMPCST